MLWKKTIVMLASFLVLALLAVAAHVLPSSGTGPATVTAGVTRGERPPGRYQGTFTVYSTSAGMQATVIAVMEVPEVQVR